METERLILRQFRKDDLNDFVSLIRDKMTAEYSKYDAQWPTDEETLAGVLEWVTDSDEWWAVEQKDSSNVIGFICLNQIDRYSRNLGYCLHTSYQGNGYGKEAVAQLIRYAKEVLCLQKITAGTAQINLPSVKLLLGNGFAIKEESYGSFVKDKDGSDVIFPTYVFELLL